MTVISQESWIATYKYLMGKINYTQLHFLLSMEGLTEDEIENMVIILRRTDELVEKAAFYYSHAMKIIKVGSWIMLSLIVFGLLWHMC